MSNTITLTFDDTLPIIGKVINLNQIDALGVQQTITWTYVNSLGAFNILKLLSDPFDSALQINLNTKNCFDAFNRDLNPALYSVTRTTNEVIVTTLTDQFTFEGANSDFDGVTIVTDYTPLVGGLPRIHIRSPYFISAPVYDGNNIVSSIATEFKIYIYEGVLDTSKPSTPTYTYEKKPRYLGDNNIYIDISKQVSDFIDNKYSGNLQTDCVFVEVEVNNTYSGGVLTETKKFLALNGYNLHQENVNHTPTEISLLSNTTISVLYGESVSVPIYLGFSGQYQINLVKNSKLPDGTPIQVVIGAVTINGLDIINTNDIVTYATFDNITDGNYIEVFIAGEDNKVIYDLEIVTECIYDPIKITFVNRFGVLQDFYSYKVSKETIKSTNDDYNKSVLNEDIIGGIPVLSYNTSEHNKKTYNKQSKKSIELNTGYIAEDNNIIIAEMLNSEYIWLTIDNVIIPANLNTKSVALLTRTNDQLIKYKLNFDYSYNEIQNIR
jgi:hypothetical protein